MSLLIDYTEQLAKDPRPERPVLTAARCSELSAGAAVVFNRLGGLLTRLSGEHGAEVASLVAIWVTQSGGRPPGRRRANLRFEVQRFFNNWGRQNRQEFDGHFKFGGHSLQPGQPWENQEYRGEVGSFTAVHHNQNSEYSALTIARMLCGDELAFGASSVGGSLLGVAEHATMGFDSCAAMFEAFQEGEAVQVVALLSYLVAHSAPKAGDLLRYLRDSEWDLFSKYYTGADQVPMDSARLRAAYAAAAILLKGKR